MQGNMNVKYLPNKFCDSYGEVIFLVTYKNFLFFNSRGLLIILSEVPSVLISCSKCQDANFSNYFIYFLFNDRYFFILPSFLGR